MTRRRCCALYCGLLLATGCLPYGYPKLAYVPGYDPNGRKVAEVHAFRVDVTTDRADLSETAEWSITEVARTSDGRFPPQARLSVERGFNVFGPLTYNVGRSHTTRVRLYSPGHQLVELDSWDSSDKVLWQITADWSARERAIDDLVQPPRQSGTKKPAAVSPASGPAFAFAATEYEEIAANAATPEEAARLKRKAEGIRPVTVTPRPTR